MYQNNGYQQNGYQNNGYQGGGYQQPAQNGNALGWNDDFEAQESSFVLLPEGDYAFEITKIEKARHSGSEKVPPCNKAIVTFCVHAQQGDTYITENYLLIDLDWARRKMTEFFSAIGFAEKGGQRVRMHWGNDLIGRRGVCHVAPRKYKNNDGDERETNDLKKLYPIWNQPNLEPIAPPQNTGYMQPNQGYNPPAQGYNPPPQNTGYQPQNGWNGGGIY
jgi:hypothetical protein